MRRSELAAWRPLDLLQQGGHCDDGRAQARRYSLCVYPADIEEISSCKGMAGSTAHMERAPDSSGATGVVHPISSISCSWIPRG